MATDLDLFEAWACGDREAGDQLFERHFESIFRFFSHKVSGDVQDLIQTTFLACVESRDRFRRESSFRTYLFGVARKKLYAHWRDKTREANFDAGVTSLCDLGASPPSAVAANQQQRLLLEALRRIPLDLQIAIELHYWEEMTGPELAEVLEIPEGTVRSRLRRAREAVSAELETLASSPAMLASTIDDLDRWARSLRVHLRPG